MYDRDSAAAFVRESPGMDDADTTEISPGTKNPTVYLLPDLDSHAAGEMFWPGAIRIDMEPETRYAAMTTSRPSRAATRRPDGSRDSDGDGHDDESSITRRHWYRYEIDVWMAAYSVRAA